MEFNPIPFIVICGIAAAISVTTAIVTVLEERKKLKESPPPVSLKIDDVIETRGVSSITVQIVRSPTVTLSR